MKKIVLLLLLFVSIFVLTSCTVKKKGNEDELSNGTEQEVVKEELFCVFDGMEVTYENNKKTVIQTAKLGGVTYTLKTDFSTRNAENISMEQLGICTRVFWYCYPKMYERFAIKDTPVEVKLFIGKSDYEIAYTIGNSVYLNDKWLKEHPEDYDCLTHEFAHVIQAEWDERFVPVEGEDSYFIERFADCMRYLYSYQNGYYNDAGWQLKNADEENSYVSSVRFWLWLEYTYSSGEKDIFQRICFAIGDQKPWALVSEWEDGKSAWSYVLAFTGAQGKTLSQLWEEYKNDPFAYADSSVPAQGELSELERTYHIREKW